MIHIGRGSTNLGSFSERDVREGLASGRFLPTDLGWREGMANWQPLSEFNDLAGPPPLAPTLAPGIPELPEEAVPGRTGLPWENLPHNILAFIETMKLVLSSPGEAFSRMRLEGGLTGPLIYNIAGSWIGLVVALSYQLLYSRANPVSGPASEHPFLVTSENATAALVVAVVLGPLFILLGAFVGAFFTQLCLMLVGGANKPFEATLRVLCFTVGSVQLLQLVPVCGGLICFVWQIVCLTVGLSRVHEISIGRALTAVFLPIIVCCGGFLVAGIFFYGYSVHTQIGH